MPSWCCAKATTAKSIPTRPFMRTTMSPILALPVTCASVTFGASFWPVSPLISACVIRRRTRIARDLSRLSLKTPAAASTSTAPWLRRGRRSASSASAVLLQHLLPTDVPIFVLAAYGLISRPDDSAGTGALSHVVHYWVPVSCLNVLPSLRCPQSKMIRTYLKITASRERIHLMGTRAIISGWCCGGPTFCSLAGLAVRRRDTLSFVPPQDRYVPH